MPLLKCPRSEATYQDVLDTMSLWNIPLCVLICLLNSVVIHHYYRQTTKLTSLLFLLISLSDLGTALGQSVIAISVLCLYGTSHISSWTATGIVMFHALFGLLGYACSIFFNVVMAVIRTINICNPFYRLNKRILKLAVFFHVMALLLLCFMDLYYDAATNNTFNRPWFTIWFNMVMAYVGHNLVYDLGRLWIVKLPFGVQISITATLVSLIFLIPVVLVVMCLITQLIVVEYRRYHTQSPRAWLLCCPRASCSDATRDTSGDHVCLTDWNHVNVTVFLLSLVFVICNSGIAALTIYYKVVFSEVGEGSVGECFLQGIVSSTLPLLSALLTPLIIISRSSSLRGDVVSSLRAAWLVLRRLPAGGDQANNTHEDDLLLGGT